MQDFNLRPEVMGFGSPIRAETTAPPAPADDWKARAGGFEVNGLGQLRTAFELPASEAEIAADMCHHEFPLIEMEVGQIDQFVIFKSDSAINKASEPKTLMGGTWGGMARKLKNAWAEYEKALVHDTIHGGPLSLAPASPEGFYGKGLPSFAVVSNPHTNACQCDSCTGLSLNRWAPHPSDDQRPLSEILAERGQKAQANAISEYNAQQQQQLRRTMETYGL